MLFHEIYGNYYNVIAAVLTEALDGTLDRKRMMDLIREKAFCESSISIPKKLEGGDWHLMTGQYKTSLRQKPQMPLTTLQKRWLKTLSLDPRIQLFQPDLQGLEEVKPLFTPEMIVYYDRNLDGDPVSSETYILHFRTILDALEQGTSMEIVYENPWGKRNRFFGTPVFLEYSQKDDKFRLKFREGQRTERFLNVSRICSCKTGDAKEATDAVTEFPGIEPHTVTLRVRDDRNTLERILLHFSHLEKETKRLDADHYQVKLIYDALDETEILIRILAFGPKVRVTAPECFIKMIRERLCKQHELLKHS